MDIKISARHGHLSEPTREFIRDKAQKVIHHFPRIMMIEVTVDLQDERNPKVEFLLSAEHKHDFVAHESAPDLLAAIEMAVAKLDHQICRYKEKIQDHRRRPHAGEVPSHPHAEPTDDN